MNQRHNHLEQLFGKLHQSRSLSLDANSLDSIAIVCLRILEEVYGSNHVTKLIAHQLSLVLTHKKTVALKPKLQHDLTAIDGQLEEHLRGFARLFAWVAEEEEIGVDSARVLEDLQIDDGMRAIFLKLTQVVNAYTDLDDAFGVEAPRAVVVLFIHAFTDVLHELTQDKKNSEELVDAWLNERVKRLDLLTIYQDFKHVGLPSQGPSCALFKEKIIVRLCLKIARAEPIDFDEGRILDEALSEMGMFGMSPLIDSGFLVLQNRDHHYGKTTAKIRRI